MLLMAIPMSVWNGFLEEVLWRGTFTALFPRQTMLGIIYPALGFAAWHLGPFLAKSPWDSQEVLMLLGGGTVLGLLELHGCQIRHHSVHYLLPHPRQHLPLYCPQHGLKTKKYQPLNLISSIKTGTPRKLFAGRDSNR
ncbi:MAG: CPBP family intramembrane metalloprotease [Firmicutes bacterium]|nr:CPBP family intramembrane metalloprotease [Bacillota bacterium]